VIPDEIFRSIAKKEQRKHQGQNSSGKVKSRGSIINIQERAGGREESRADVQKDRQRRRHSRG